MASFMPDRVKYLNLNGDSAFSMTSNGRLWASSLDTRDDESGMHNYVIRDSNCDGVFDEGLRSGRRVSRSRVP